MFISVRFAGAVLAEQPEDLAGPDLQIDVGVGDEIAEALGDAAKLDVQESAPPHHPCARMPARGSSFR